VRKFKWARLFSPSTLVIAVFIGFIQAQSYDMAFSDSLKKDGPVIKYDSIGIPIVDYGEVAGIYIGPQRNPITVSTTAIDTYSKFRQSGNQTFKDQIIHNVDWLVSHSKSRNGFSVLEYEFPWPSYNLRPPWVSGMAQGLALRALIIGHQLIDNDTYLDTAKMLLNSFFVDMQDGGVTHKDTNNEWWYEEYAKSNGTSPRVLNGMMYTLLGIHEYYKYSNDTSAKYLFDKGIASLVTNLQKYDDPKYSYSFYDAFHTSNPLSYHKVHIDLLEKLWKITEIGPLKFYHDRWENYTPPPFLS
jgi:heparosan-N-sulfate-glucuronate 5-epimerase